MKGRKNIYQVDSDFKKRMNKNIEKSYYNHFIENNSWTVSDQLKSLSNIESTINHFQQNYDNLKFSSELDESFMTDSNPSLFIIDGTVIVANDKETMMKSFTKITPDIQTQKLISTYANQNFLHQSYVQLVSEHPEIQQYQIKNSRNLYIVDTFVDGSIKLVATNLSDLKTDDNNPTQKYKSFGTRATIVLSPYNLPTLKYSHFVK
ncbi:hypothetical protein D9V59_02930 [Buchnera aphidicola (Artemisaphis artemisicola)]|uniref:Uncharacterized protein n=1 Tax=Buchnera aphidicola (Artemisaphis artemisicola) TaxID=1241836 RepID=A0A4D6XMS1_9GAMM|nr:hypothetical protein D9V59_02930 [Buchnera aphidicola (Artemisaphis artemisicola)]